MKGIETHADLAVKDYYAMLTKKYRVGGALGVAP